MQNWEGMGAHKAQLQPSSTQGIGDFGMNEDTAISPTAFYM